jgi:hypothetical protein
MTSKAAHLPVLNSLLFIGDANIRNIPEIDGTSNVWSTTSCIAVSCLPDSDGETEVTIGPALEVGQQGNPVFEGRLMTPSGRVIVETVLGERILEVDVARLDTRVRIWTNGLRDTDRVIVGLE